MAVDTVNYESLPDGRELAGASRPAIGRLFAIAVGTDRYDDKQNFDQLSLAKTDADNFGKSIKALGDAAYGSVELTSFLHESGLQSKLLAKIDEVVTNASERDTIMLFAAGHGVRDASSGEFFLITRDTLDDQLNKTGIGWSEISRALDGAKGRVIVFLDACHSGAAGNGANDDAVSTFLNRKASVAVIAASKGRQESMEFGAGGAFTTALVSAINEERNATDTNHNGVIELAELYSAVKRKVVSMTKGKQTPWIARNLMVGEAPLF